MGLRDRQPNRKSRPSAQKEDAEPTAKIVMSFVACVRDLSGGFSRGEQCRASDVKEERPLLGKRLAT